MVKGMTPPPAVPCAIAGVDTAVEVEVPTIFAEPGFPTSTETVPAGNGRTCIGDPGMADNCTT
jgi:hypothetical protein